VPIKYSSTYEEDELDHEPRGGYLKLTVLMVIIGVVVIALYSMTNINEVVGMSLQEAMDLSEMELTHVDGSAYMLRIFSDDFDVDRDMPMGLMFRRARFTYQVERPGENASYTIHTVIRGATGTTVDVYNTTSHLNQTGDINGQGSLCISHFDGWNATDDNIISWLPSVDDEYSMLTSPMGLTMDIERPVGHNTHLEIRQWYRYTGPDADLQGIDSHEYTFDLDAIVQAGHFISPAARMCQDTGMEDGD